jgi:hypothetical protein
MFDYSQAFSRNIGWVIKEERATKKSTGCYWAGGIVSGPRGLHFDAYLNKLKKS